jgi:hypothetical protein
MHCSVALMLVEAHSKLLPTQPGGRDYVPTASSLRNVSIPPHPSKDTLGTCVIEDEYLYHSKNLSYHKLTIIILWHCAVCLPSSVHGVVGAAGICDVGMGGGAYAEAPPQSAPLSLHANTQPYQWTAQSAEWVETKGYYANWKIITSSCVKHRAPLTTCASTCTYSLSR